MEGRGGQNGWELQAYMEYADFYCISYADFGREYI